MRTLRSIRDRLVPTSLYFLITLPIYYALVLWLQPTTGLSIRAIGFLVVLPPAWTWGLGSSVAAMAAIHLTNTALDEALGRPSSLFAAEGLPPLVASMGIALLIRRLRVLGDQVKQGLHERLRVETRARESEAQARESESCYRQMFEGNPQPMLILDAVTQMILSANAVAVAQYGFELEALRSMTLADLAPPDDRPWPDEPRPWPVAA
ncbi:PAS domain S-box protein, partial [Singulisphaera rosea]